MENGENTDRDGEKKSVDGESGLRLVMECQEQILVPLKYLTAGVDRDEIHKTSVGTAEAGEDGDAVHVYGFGVGETEEDGYEKDQSGISLTEGGEDGDKVITSGKGVARAGVGANEVDANGGSYYQWWSGWQMQKMQLVQLRLD